jgi:serine/threonine-protein kinase RsbW
MVDLFSDSVQPETTQETGTDFGAFTGSSVHSNRSIILTAQFGNLDRVREFVAESAEECGLEPAAVYAVQLAVDEAFTNIIEHAYGGESLERIECSCQTDRDSLEVTLMDCGKPFDPSLVPEPNLTAELEEREVGGIGLFFIYQLMDEVQFSFTKNLELGKNCNLLRMIKRKEK